MRLRTSIDVHSNDAVRSDAMLALNAKMNEFFESTGESDGGWAKVEKDDLSSLYDIIVDIVALKYETDADGDLPINIALCDRNQGYLYHETIPYGPDRQEVQGEEYELAKISYHSEMAQVIQGLTSQANELSRQLNYRLSEESRDRKEKLKLVRAAAKFAKLVESRENDQDHWEDDRTEALRLVKDEFTDCPDLCTKVQQAMVSKYTTRLEQAAAESVKVMKSFKSEEDEDFHTLVRRPRTVWHHVFGDAFAQIPAVNREANRLYTQGRADRDAARRERAAARKSG